MIDNIASISEKMNGWSVTKSLIEKELTGIFNSETLMDMNQIIKDYNVYENGARFIPEGNGDITPSQLSYRIVKTLIDKEARFMFSNPPNITITTNEDQEDKKNTGTQDLVNAVLEANKFNSNLVKAAKDELIGKRIAIMTTHNEKGIQIAIIPSLEFIYETDPADVNRITKFIQFYSTVVNKEKSQQRVYKNKWEIADDTCYVSEEIYDGNGRIIETITERHATKDKKIPVEIVINEGLLGDPFGNSEVDVIDRSMESYYSKLGNKDIDSLRKGMDQIIWAIDMSPKTTKDLSRSPGAFWDLSSDPAQDGHTGQVGVLDNNMSYSGALDTTLKRMRTEMFATVDVPDTSNEALQGIITSGKSMRAIYWGLITRCNEKMLQWIPAIENTAKNIINGAILYPESTVPYGIQNITDQYDVEVVNTYPIMEDEAEEKATDLAEVTDKTMSRKAYMQKWHGMSDEEVEDELKQIQFEQQLLEQDNYMFTTGDEE